MDCRPTQSRMVGDHYEVGGVVSLFCSSITQVPTVGNVARPAARMHWIL